MSATSSSGSFTSISRTEPKLGNAYPGIAAEAYRDTGAEAVYALLRQQIEDFLLQLVVVSGTKKHYLAKPGGKFWLYGVYYMLQNFFGATATARENAQGDKHEKSPHSYQT